MKYANAAAAIAVLALALAGAGTAMAATITINAIDEGWINAAGTVREGAYYMAGNCSNDQCRLPDNNTDTGEYRNFFIFHIPSITGYVQAAQLNLNTGRTSPTSALLKTDD